MVPPTRSVKRRPWHLVPLAVLATAAAALVLAVPLDPAGELDTSFSLDGKVVVNLREESVFAEAWTVGIQSTGKIVLGGDYDGGGGLMHFAMIRLNVDGTQDFTFGDGGVVKTTLASNDYLYDMKILADDSIVAAGTASTADEDFAVARYTAEGQLDTGFGGGDGTFITGVGPDFDRAQAMGVQSDGKIVVVGYSDNPDSSNRDISVIRVLADGSGLDTTFDGDGKVFTALGSGTDQGRDVAILAGNKILVAGRCQGADADVALVRYNANGSLDTSFNGDGKASHDLGGAGSTAYARAMTVQGDGRIVVGAGSNTMYLARYTANGDPDPTFNGTGYVSAAGTASDVLVQPDGRLLLLGVGFNGDNFEVLRRNSNGSADTGFDGDGRVIVDFGVSEQPNALVLDASDRIVAVGYCAIGSDYHMAATRLNVNGSLDTTFRDTGKFYTQVIAASRDEAQGMTAQADGKPIVVGFSGNSAPDFGIARFALDGSLDTDFSTDGLAFVDTGDNDTARAAAMQADGKVVVVGDTYGSGSPTFTLARLNPDGTPDATFSGDGIARTSFGSNSSRANAVAIQADGKIVAGGSGSSSSSSSDWALARFNVDGTLDTGFDGDGKVTRNIRTYDNIYAIVIQPDGKIVVAGDAMTNGGDGLFAIARYNPNGSLDTGFGGGVVQTKLTPAGHTSRDEIRGLALLPDGRIVAGGRAFNAADRNACGLARYNPDGTLDASFGSGGIVVFNTAASGVDDQLYAIGLQVDDKIVGFGTRAPLATGFADFLLARFNWDDGSLDTTYATAGFATTSFGVRSSNLTGGAVLAGGLAVGSGYDSASSDYAAARYLGDPAPTVPSAPVLANDTGTSSTDGVTRVATVGGSCVDGETVLLKVDGSDTAPLTRVLCRSSAYTLTPTLADGTYTFAVSAKNGAGESAITSAITVTLDTFAAPQVITSPAEGSTVLPEPPVVGGDAEAGAAVVVREIEGWMTVCSFTAASEGAWSCGSTLGPGTYLARAWQTDIAGNASADSAVRTFMIKAPTTTAVATSVTPSRFGQTVTFTATVTSSWGTPSGTVNFVIDGGAPQPAALSAGVATYSTAALLVGDHTVDADYLESQYHFASSGSLAGGQSVIKADSGVALGSSANPSVFGQSVTFTATVSAVAPGAGTPTGTVTFRDGAASLCADVALAGGVATCDTATLTVATHAITADYSGDAGFNASTGSLDQVVDKAGSTVAVGSSANPSVFGQIVTFTATVSAVAPGAGTPTGTVTFRDGAASLCADVALVAGAATCDSATLSVATHPIAADYSGDAGFGASASSLDQQVDRAATGTAITSHAPDPSGVGEIVTVTFAVTVVPPGAGSPAGDVTVSDGEVTCSAAVAVGGCDLVFASVGTHTLTASYAGDANFAGSTSAGADHAVSPVADVAVAAAVDVATPAPGQDVTLTVTARNDGPSDATGVHITAPLPPGLALVSATPSVGTYDGPSGRWEIGPIADGAAATLALVATVERTEALSLQAVKSGAGEDDPDPSNNAACIGLNTPSTADVQLHLRVDDRTPAVAQAVTFTVMVRNAGPAAATGVEVTDVLPPELTFVAASPSQGTYDPASGAWDVGALAAGAPATLELTATVGSAAAVTNVAARSAGAEADSAAGNDAASVTLNPAGEADLSLSASASQDPVAPGTGFAYVLVVSNQGPAVATAVTVVDTLPPEVALDSWAASQGSCSGTTEVTCSLGDLGAGGSAVLHLLVTKTGGASFTSSASVAAVETDPYLANNSVTTGSTPVELVSFTAE